MISVFLTPKAELSLKEIAEYYLTEFSLERSEKVITSIEEVFVKIAVSPKAYPVCFDISFPSENIRQAIVHNTFKIVYKLSMNEIKILEIFHGSRNPELLKDIE